MEINGEKIDVDQLRDDWALALMEQGVIVKLTISRWRASSKLKYEELGISFNNSEHQDFMANYINLGHEKLFPPRILREIHYVETRARRALLNHSFSTIWGRFVPYSAFQNWKAENESIREEFINLAKDIGENYDDIIQEVKEEYEKMGRDVWRRLYPDDNEDPPVSFLENFTSRIIDKIPNREKIVSSFKYYTTFFSIPLPSFIQEDIAKAEDIVREREMKAHEQVLEIQTRELIAEGYRERKKELIDTFLESTVSFLRHHIAELAEHTYQVLKRYERGVSMAHVKKIKRMINQVQTLNFHNDKEINDILSELNTEVSKYKGERDKKVIKEKLRELVDLSKNEYMPEGFNPIVEIIDIK